MRTISNSKCQKRYEELLKEEDSSSKTEKRECNHCNSGVKLFIVGIGPGDSKYLTIRAKEVLQQCDVVVAYKNYIKYVKHLIEDKEIYTSGMTQEITRAEKAVEFALNGKSVAVISTGDAGIYGMSGLILEILHSKNLLSKISFEVIPGVSAFNAAASVIGAPIMHDFAVISLSDLLTDWQLIEKRIALASKGDFVIAIYNPKSKKRITHIEKAKNIMLQYKAPSTPVAIVKNALREGESVILTTLSDFLKFEIDMLSVIIIGNSQSKIIDNRYFLTPRGYKI